jgi:hypothetical protein
MNRGIAIPRLVVIALLALTAYVPAASVGAATGPAQSVTGSGWRGNVTNQTTPITHFIVSAQNGSSGVSGTYISMNPDNALLNFSGQVTCLYVVGNQAIVGGVVTSGGEPGQIGTGFAVGFTDYASPTADTVTFGDLEIPTPVDCAAETFLFTLTNFPVLNGNVVVSTSS